MAWVASEAFFAIKAWWAQVTVTPEERRIMVLRRGTWAGLNGSTPIGGHSSPNSVTGANLLWKNAQKNEKKNITSDTINKIIPNRSPVKTLDVWRPWKVASRETSRHHWNVIRTITPSPVIINIWEALWNHWTIPSVRDRRLTAPTIGQGLWSTIWKMWLDLIVIGNFIRI